MIAHTEFEGKMFCPFVQLLFQWLNQILQWIKMNSLDSDESLKSSCAVFFLYLLLITLITFKCNGVFKNKTISNSIGNAK
jgi:hypothetical protein